MDVFLTSKEIIVRLFVSALVAFIVGLNRERHSSAGIRTHMILAVGACAITLIQIDLIAENIKWSMQHPEYAGLISTDIGRLTAQIVSGIGFLGSGLILIRNEHKVDGMTSAVSLWTVASISIAIGYGKYLIGLLSAGFLMLILTTLSMKSTRFSIMELKLRLKEHEIKRQDMNQFLAGYQAKVVNYTMENISNNENHEYRYVFEIEYRGFIDKIDFIDQFIEQHPHIIYIELD